MFSLKTRKQIIFIWFSINFQSVFYFIIKNKKKEAPDIIRMDLSSLCSEGK